MNAAHHEFLLKLADLTEQYNATFSYNRDDDGIHITVDGKLVFVGFMFDPATELREAVAYERRP